MFSDVVTVTFDPSDALSDIVKGVAVNKSQNVVTSKICRYM